MPKEPFEMLLSGPLKSWYPDINAVSEFNQLVINMGGSSLIKEDNQQVPLKQTPGWLIAGCSLRRIHSKYQWSAFDIKH